MIVIRKKWSLLLVSVTESNSKVLNELFLKLYQNILGCFLVDTNVYLVGSENHLARNHASSMQFFLALIDCYYRDKKKFSEGKIKQWTTLSTVLVA